MAQLKKILAGAMALCMAGSVLTACGKSGEEWHDVESGEQDDCGQGQDALKRPGGVLSVFFHSFFLYNSC